MKKNEGKIKVYYYKCEKCHATQWMDKRKSIVKFCEKEEYECGSEIPLKPFSCWVYPEELDNFERL